MNKMIRVLTVLTLLIFFVSPTTAQIIKELPTKAELDNFTVPLNNTPDYTNIATSEATEHHPTWPHDKWTDKKGKPYVSFYYENSTAPKGYTSVYFDDCGYRLGSVCGITFKLVEAYPGLEVEDTDPVDEVIPDENNTTEEVTNDTQSGFQMNIYNETTGAAVDIAADIPNKVSEEGQRDYLEGIKHFFNAVFGWDL